MTATLDRAKAFTSTTGTGTVTLGLAVIPYQTWASAGALNATVYPYLIEDGNAWEEGYGTYTTSGTTLTRNMTSSSTGSLLSLSGNATVACVQRSVDGINMDGAGLATDDTTTSTSYGALSSTSGPAVTLVTGTSALLVFGSLAYKSGGTGNTPWISPAVSGATTVVASDANGAAESEAISTSFVSICRTLKLTGLTPGSNTFTLQYRVDGGTYHFANRNILVISGT